LVSELKPATILVNHRWITADFCADKPCASYAQMSAEG
jgi:hypothetical protein